VKTIPDLKAVRREKRDQGEVLSAVTHGSWKRVDLRVVINQANPDFPVIAVPGLAKMATIRNRLVPAKAVADLTNRDLSTSRRDLIDPIVAIDQVDLIDPTILGINEPLKEVKVTDLPVDLANRAVSTNPRSLAISESFQNLGFPMTAQTKNHLTVKNPLKETVKIAFLNHQVVAELKG
jgi:hypothetical protein